MSPVANISFGDDGSALTVIVSPAPRGAPCMDLVVGETGELMRFTDYFDKNGKEIYEGDIIQSHSNFLVEFRKYTDSDDNGHTGFTLRCVNFKYASIPFGFGNDYSGEISETMIVIGNIFENPELIPA
jgi:uncharacterized phage protein (TIGR01671 family)